MKRRYTINIKIPSLLFLAVVTTSFAAIFVKMSESPSSILSMYRMFLACLLILPCTIKFLPELKTISSKVWISIVGAGACLSLHLGLWFESLKMTTVASSTVILSLQPIIALVASYIIYKNIVDTRIIFSILVSFGGIVIINISDFSMSNLTILIGNALSFLSAIAMVAYLILGQKGAKSLTHWLYSFLVFFFAGIFLLIYNIFINVEFFDYSTKEWGFFVLLAIFPTVTHVIFNYLLSFVEPTSISMSIILEPIITSILALIILNEKLSWVQILGSCISLFGIYMFLAIKRKQRSIMI